MIDRSPLLLEVPKSPVDAGGERRRLNRRVRALTAAAALLGLGAVLVPRDAAAAGDEDDAVVVHRAELPSLRARPQLEPRGMAELALHRELDWLRLTLADDLALRLGPISLDGTVRGFDAGQIDIRSDMWSAAPRAMTSVATAATSLLTSGISVFEVWRGGQIQARHGLRMYWRSRGLMMAWRLEF